MIAENICNMNPQGLQSRSKAFSFSIASILGENNMETKTENKVENTKSHESNQTEIRETFTADMFPIDHSTPKPDIIVQRPDTHAEPFNNNQLQTDILKQSWEIAFASEQNESFEQSPYETANSDGNASPNLSHVSGSHSCTSSPVEEPRRKKARTSFSARQLRELETHYASMRYISAADRSSLARSLGLTDQQVKTWFQNRRMKEKRNWNGEGDQQPLPENATPSPQPGMHPALMGYPAQPAPNMLPLLPPASVPGDSILHRPRPITHIPNAPLATVPAGVLPHMAQFPRQPAFVRVPLPQTVSEHLPVAMSHHGLNKPSFVMAAEPHYQSAFTKIAATPATMFPGVAGAAQFAAPSLGLSSQIPAQMTAVRAPMYPQLAVPTPVYM